MVNGLCVYGCGKPSLYFHRKTGAGRCSKNPVHCSFLTSKGHVAGQVSLSTVDPETGLSPNQIGGANSIALARAEGRFVAQSSKGGYASSAKQSKMILPDGRSQLQHTGSNNLLLRRQTMSSDGRTTIAEHHARKAAQTRKTIRLENGLTIQEDINRRVNLERGKDGLSRSERGIKKSGAFKSYKDTSLLYQGSYEEAFLCEIDRIHGAGFVAQHVRRGPPIEYRDETGRERHYYPDFIINNSIYEIKSSWTFQQNIDRNRLKLNAAKQQGFGVYLVLCGTIFEVDFDG